MMPNADDHASCALTEALEEYLGALERGEPPEREAFLARHPDLAEELAPCLTALEFMQRPGRPGDDREGAGAIGDFEIKREIGRGGMGVVYEAEQISLRRRVALKMLPFAGVLDPRHLQRFRNEALAAASLHHDHIVPVYSVGSDRGVHYYAMQYIDGVSLDDLLRELAEENGVEGESSSAARTLTGGHGVRTSTYCRSVARLGVDAARALDHAHEQGVVHRDVKPGNLLLDDRGSVWVTDFGLASCGRNEGLTMTGDILGTVRYMSPEQARGKRAVVDHRTDVYSLGASLYEMLTLAPAFPGDQPHEVLRDIAQKDPVPPRRLNPAVPEQLGTILGKAMAKVPEDRYDTAGDLAEDLERYLQDRPIRARRPSLPKLLAQWSRRHRAFVRAAATVLVLAVVGLAWGTALLAKERSEAERQARRFESLYGRARSTLDRLLDEVSDRLGLEPQLADTQRLLLREMLDFHEGFLRDEERGAVVPREIVLAHLSAGRIQTFLGEHEEALAHLRTAVDLLADDGGADLAQAHLYLHDLWRSSGDHVAAQRSAEQALLAARDLATRSPEPRHRLLLAQAQLALAGSLAEAGETEQALGACGRADGILGELFDDFDRRDVGYMRQLARTYERMGKLLAKAGRTLGARDAQWRAGYLLEELEMEFPEADFRTEKWRKEGDAREMVWAALMNVEPHEPSPAVLDGVERMLKEVGPVEVAKRPITALPSEFHAKTVLHAPWGESPWVCFRFKGVSSHFGECEGTTRGRLWPTVDGNATLGTAILDFGNGDSIEIWSLGLPSQAEEQLRATFVLRNGKGRFAGVTGKGVHTYESILLSEKDGLLGAGVLGEARGTIWRED